MKLQRFLEAEQANCLLMRSANVDNLIFVYLY